VSESATVIVGFIPLLDCAPLVVAAEKGFAAEEGIDLRLARETSWASIRDRLIVGHFDAAHMLGPMALASTLGIGHLRVPLIAPLSLGLGGNAITASNALWAQMQTHGAASNASPQVQGAALRAVVTARERARKPALTLAMVMFASWFCPRHCLSTPCVKDRSMVSVLVIPGTVWRFRSALAASSPPPPLSGASVRKRYWVANWNGRNVTRIVWRR
jgi:NitT/TauT family transport system ATP-binding protein